MAKVCAFFGHRNIPDDLEPRLRELIVRAVTEYGVTEFWDGCYGGFDVLAAQVVISLKAQFPQIRLVQVYAYPPASDGLRAGFDSAFCPDILDSFPDKWRIPRRNLWMAKQCDMAIAYVEHAGSRIYEPLDALCGEKPILNLGGYQPKKAAKTE